MLIYFISLLMFVTERFVQMEGQYFVFLTGTDSKLFWVREDQRDNFKARYLPLYVSEIYQGYRKLAQANQVLQHKLNHALNKQAKESSTNSSKVCNK